MGVDDVPESQRVPPGDMCRSDGMRKRILKMSLPFVFVSVIVVILVRVMPRVVFLASLLSIGLLPLAYVLSVVAIPVAVALHERRMSEKETFGLLSVVVAVVINMIVAGIALFVMRSIFREVYYEALRA
jgi:hypothetical protein